MVLPAGLLLVETVKTPSPKELANDESVMLMAEVEKPVMGGLLHCKTGQL